MGLKGNMGSLTWSNSKHCPFKQVRREFLEGISAVNIFRSNLLAEQKF